MEQAPQFVVFTREELSNLIEEIMKKFQNQGITPYPSREEGTTTKVFTRTEVAAILKCSPNNVTNYIKQKKLHASVINRQYRINEKELIKFINQKVK